MNFSLLHIPVILYAVLNILAFIVFTHDKFRAKMKVGRSPEESLLLIAVLGPLGALIAMAVFRHKTRHMKFILVPVFLILHLLLFFWLWPHIAG